MDFFDLLPIELNLQMNVIRFSNSLSSLANTNDDVTGSLLLSVSCYDDFGCLLRTISDNHPGGKEVVYTNYSFTGQVTETTTLHNHGQVNQVILATTYTYDNQGRMTAGKLKINEADEVTLVAHDNQENFTYINSEYRLLK